MQITKLELVKLHLCASYPVNKNCVYLCPPFGFHFQNQFVYDKTLGWEHSQNKGPRTRQLLKAALYFGNVPHPWALPIIKQKANFIMNQTYINYRHMNDRVLIPISRHNFPPTLQE
jgi:hypothetical protein